MNLLDENIPEHQRQLLRGPLGATASNIQSFAAEQGLECSDPVEGIIYCSVPTRSNMAYVAAKWLMRFHVDQGKLTKIEVEKGLIGP
jgi:hypothetical protein